MSKRRSDAAELATIESRLRDYAKSDVREQRKALVAAWRAAYPEAAAQQSPAHQPLFKDPHYRKDKNFPDKPDEMWFNPTYFISVRRHPEDRVFGTKEGVVQIGISSLDGTARHDWREFQAIKNQIAGPECEAFELYPAESRLLDPSNYYTLWCFPGVKRLRIGEGRRDVRDAEEALSPQRAMGGGE